MTLVHLQRAVMAGLLAASLAPPAWASGVDQAALVKEIQARKQDPEITAWLARDLESARRIRLLEAELKASAARARSLREAANEANSRGAPGEPGRSSGGLGLAEAGRAMSTGPSPMELRMAATEEVARAEDLLVELAMAYREIKAHVEAAKEDQRTPRR